MKTYACLFTANTYQREELEKLNNKELYDFASVASTVGYGEADVLTLEDLSQSVNNGSLDLSDSWLYFVTI